MRSSGALIFFRFSLDRSVLLTSNFDFISSSFLLSSFSKSLSFGLRKVVGHEQTHVVVSCVIIASVEISTSVSVSSETKNHGELKLCSRVGNKEIIVI